MNNFIPVDILKKMREMLPNDWASKIAEQTSFSEGYIRKIMRGEKYNETVINLAISIIEENDNAKRKLAKRARTLTTGG